MKVDKELTELHAAATGISPGEIIIGVISGISAEGKALVDYAENMSDSPLPALSTVAIHHQHINRQVALLFANGDPQSPVIMGLIHDPLEALLENHIHVEKSEEVSATDDEHAEEGDQQVVVDGKRLVIEGREEVVLKCGDASITLTRAGKILIRGKYLLSRSSGVNRILGGSVQVN